ncbi:hypothetical protein GF371_04315 [Candidatus Woesearchaeota archaeon]|nr:hypothetical protein [Candidatus Woesearchaeota archaeon]
MEQWKDEFEGPEYDSFDTGEEMLEFEKVRIEQLEDAFARTINDVNRELQAKLDTVVWDDEKGDFIREQGQRCTYEKLPPSKLDDMSKYDRYWVGYQFMMPDFFRSRKKDPSDYTIHRRDLSCIDVIATPSLNRLAIGARPLGIEVFDFEQFRDRSFHNLNLETEHINSAVDYLQSEKSIRNFINQVLMHNLRDYLTDTLRKEFNNGGPEDDDVMFFDSFDSMVEHIESPGFKKNLVGRAVKHYELVTAVKANLVKTIGLMMKHTMYPRKLDNGRRIALRYFIDVMDIKESSDPDLYAGEREFDLKRRFRFVEAECYKQLNNPDYDGLFSGKI